MAKQSVRPLKPVDRVAYEPVMIALSKARAMAWVLGELAEADGSGNNLVNAFDQDHEAPEEALGWTRSVVTEALHAAHDDLERAYRTLGTNLLAKDAASLTPKDGA
jgi:hypothetical protein